MTALGVLAHPTILASAVLILALVFLLGAWSKLRAREAFEGVVYNYRLLPEPAVLPASYLVPASELAVGLGLLWPSTRTYAAMGALLLLVVFTVAIAVNLARGRREIDCGCFSSVLKQRLSGGLVVRNIVLIGLAAWLAWGGEPLVVGWLDWLLGLVTAAAAALIYVSASLLAAQGASAARNPKEA